jgi:DNA-binding transcriptional regulator LsrR (DeoR family)
VARRYYIDRVSRVAIAEEFHISRFKVARLIDRAHAEGLVRIEIFDPYAVDPALSEALRSAFGLRRALVLAEAPQPRTQIGALAGRHLSEVVRPGARVGLAWSPSTHVLVDHLRDLPPCRFVQLCGVLPRTAEEEQSVDLVRRAARAVGGTAATFYSPFVVPDAPTAAALRRQPGIAEALHECDALDVAVITVGEWRRGESTVHDALSAADQALFRRRGAVAESCGILFAADGTPLRDGMQQRVVAVTARQLQRAGEVVVLATESDRAPAVLALLRSGLGHALITHRAVAEALLAEDATR